MQTLRQCYNQLIKAIVRTSRTQNSSRFTNQQSALCASCRNSRTDSHTDSRCTLVKTDVLCIETAIEWAEDCKRFMLEILPMNLTNAEEQRFQNATECYICRKPFANDDIRVRDHCHHSGKFRGAAHNQCNLGLQTKIEVPVFFHNFKGYDSHFIVRALNRLPNQPTPKVFYYYFYYNFVYSILKFALIIS